VTPLISVANQAEQPTKQQRCQESYVQTPTTLLIQSFWIRCQAKFLTSAKFLTCCLSVILLLRIKKAGNYFF